MICPCCGNPNTSPLICVMCGWSLEESEREDDCDLFGEVVTLIRIDRHGQMHSLDLPAAMAVMQLGYGELNGSYYRRAWIVADGIDMGSWDRSV